MNFLANLLEMLGTNFATGGVQGCKAFFIDEPEMPTCLLEK